MYSTIWNRASQLPGHADLGDAAAFDAATVGDPDIAADRDSGRVFEKRQRRRG